MESPAIAGLTSDDWREMIKDLYVDYGKRMEEHRKFLEENKDIKDWCYPFCAFDLKTERAEAEKELLKQLEGWSACYSAMHNGVVEKTESDVLEEWEEYCESKQNEVEKSLDGLYDYVNVDFMFSMSRKDIRDKTYGPRIIAWKGEKRIDIPVDEAILQDLENKWDELGICDNADVLKSGKARFVVHFDDNEYCALDGVDSEMAGWETESYTYGRLCEVFANWLVQHGKVPADFDWHELVNDTLTVNMHEG